MAWKPVRKQSADAGGFFGDPGFLGGISRSVGDAVGALPANFAEWLYSQQQMPDLSFLNEPMYEEVYYDDGGYYDGPSVVYMQPPAPPPYDPATDPAFQALMAQLGLKGELLKMDTAKRIGEIQREGEIAAPRIKEQGVEQRRAIDYGWEDRGLYRSGARLRDLALQQRGETQRLADLERNTANQVAGLNRRQALDLHDIASQQAEASFQAKLRAGL